MHLSPLFEAFLQDPSDRHLFDDNRFADDDLGSLGKAHKAVLLRGLAVLGVLGILIGLSFLSSAVHSTDADAAAAADDIIHCAINTR